MIDLPFVIFSALNSATRLVNTWRQIKAEKELEQMRTEANRLRASEEREKALDMFEKSRKKELEVIEIQFRNQIRLATRSAKQFRENIEIEKALDKFPLKLTPSQVYEMPKALVVVTRHEPLSLFDGKLNENSASFIDRRSALDAELSFFLQKSGYSNYKTVHAARFLDGSWEKFDLRSQAASNSLFSFLKGRATLFIEYRDLPEKKERKIAVNVSHWHPTAESDSYFNFISFKYKPNEIDIVQNRISGLQALATGIVLDMKAISENLAFPLLLEQLPDIIGKDDKVLLEATTKIFDAYMAAINERSLTTPDQTNLLFIKIAERLLTLEGSKKAKELFNEYAEKFLIGSLKNFIEQRGEKVLNHQNYTSLFNQAVLLQLPLDKEYFDLTKKARSKLVETTAKSGLTIDPLQYLPEAKLTFKEQLVNIRNDLSDLKTSIEHLIQNAPENLADFAKLLFEAKSPDSQKVFFDCVVGETNVQEVDLNIEEINKESAVKLFLDSIESDISKLANPTLRVVPVAVTSAGKSTFLGALIGRALVPIATGELSMGILRFIHSESGMVYRRLELLQGSGEEKLIEERKYSGDVLVYDNELAEEIKNAMLNYRDEGFLKNEPLPVFEIQTPLLVGKFRSLISLPEEVNLEIHDLPGLNKTNNDDRNLAVIQKQIYGSFCIFILDWNNTNNERDSNLLQVIKSALTETGADPESVIYILNRFDTRGPGDTPDYVEKRIKEFRETLSKGLELKGPPEVILTSGSMWFNSQSAWGPSAIYDKPVTPKSVRVEKLKLFANFDKASVLKSLDDSDERKDWFEDNIRSKRVSNLSDEDFRYLMEEIVYPISGADKFLAALADRLQRRCIPLVVRPQIIGTLRRVEAFLSAVDKRFIDAQIENQEEITAAIEHIRTCALRLGDIISVETENFQKLSVETIKVATERREKEKKFYEEWGRRKIDFGLFQEMVSLLRKDLAENVAKPFRNFKFGDNVPESWFAVLRKERARSLHEAANLYFRLILKYSSKDSLKVEYSVLLNDKAGEKHIQDTETAYKKLMDELVKTVTERGRFVIQQRLSEIVKQSQSLLDFFYKNIKEEMSELLSENDLQVLLAGKQPPPLVETMVETNFKPTGEIKVDEENREVAEEQTAIIRTSGSYIADSFRWLGRKLFGGSTSDLFEERKKIVWVEKEHRISVAPNGAGVEEYANQIFAKHSEELQKRLFEWLEDLLGKYAESLELASKDVSAALIDSLDKQANRIREDRSKEIEQWGIAKEYLLASHRNLKKLELATYIKEVQDNV